MAAPAHQLLPHPAQLPARLQRQRRRADIQPHHAVGQTTPGTVGLPGTVQQTAGALQIIGVPAGQHRAQQQVAGQHLAIVALEADELELAVTRHLGHGHRVGVVGEDIRPLRQQAVGGLTLQPRITPAVGPVHAHHGLRVHGPGPQRVGIDALHHLGYRDGRHIGQHPGLAGIGRQHAGQIARLVVADVVDAHVVGRLEAGIALEAHRRILARHPDDGVHEAIGGAEHQLAAVGAHLAQHPLGLLALGHTFGRHQLDARAQLLLHVPGAQRMQVAGGIRVDGAVVQKTNPQRFGRRLRGRPSSGHTPGGSLRLAGSGGRGGTSPGCLAGGCCPCALCRARCDGL